MTEWFRAVGDLKEAAGLVAVVTGRVMRKLCPECKTPFTPSPEQAKLGINDASFQLYRQAGGAGEEQDRGMPGCRGTGFFGTTAVYEVMPVDSEGRVLAGGDLKALTHARRSLGMMLLRRPLSGRSPEARPASRRSPAW